MGCILMIWGMLAASYSRDHILLFNAHEIALCACNPAPYLCRGAARAFLGLHQPPRAYFARIGANNMNMPGLSGKPPPMPREIALFELCASACVPFASACMLECADAFVRADGSQDTGFSASTSWE